MTFCVLAKVVRMDLNASERKRRERARRRRFIKRIVRMKRSFYPIRRRRFRRRRFRGNKYKRAVMHNWNRPVLVRFFTTREFVIDSDNYETSFKIALDMFNADQVRQQLYGYSDLFDQFKVINAHMRLHFKTSAEFTDLNTNIPEIFWAYDPDIKEKLIDIFNIQKLQNMHHKLVPPMKFLFLNLRPRWTERRLTLHIDDQEQVLDTHTSIPRVDNPWMDTEILTKVAGQAPKIAAANGWAVCIKNAKKRTLVVHTSVYTMFRGRKNNQAYKTAK